MQDKSEELSCCTKALAAVSHSHTHLIKMTCKPGSHFPSQFPGLGAVQGFLHSGKKSGPATFVHEVAVAAESQPMSSFMCQRITQAQKPGLCFHPGMQETWFSWVHNLPHLSRKIAMESQVPSQRNDDILAPSAPLNFCDLL